MKPAFFFFILVLLFSCQRRFKLSGDQFLIRQNQGIAAGSIIHTFDTGVYVLKICTGDTLFDGHRITRYCSCPDSVLAAAAVDKTIYLLFFEKNRILYFSGKTIFANKRGVRHANDIRSFLIDLGQQKNRDKQLLRGYYYVEPPASRDAKSCGQLHAELENYNGQVLYLNFRCEIRNDTLAPVLVMQQASLSESDVNDLDDLGPVTKGLDSVFQTRFEFFYCDSIKPNLYHGSKPLWPPQSGTNLAAGKKTEFIKAVNEALQW